jgi:protein-disulfide isomerase
VYRSPEIDASIKRAQELTRAYKVAGTPTFVVAGKYKPKHVQSERELVTLLSDLVVLAQKR